jgi:L-cystine uptake protein TcyP (sodium:dicarboxylate symporter family)
MLQFFFQQKWSSGNLRSALAARVSIATATLAFLIAVFGAIVGLETAHVLDERAKALEVGKRDTANLVKSLIQHADLTFRTADAVLLGIVEQSEHDGLEAKAGRERLTSWFQQAVS